MDVDQAKLFENRANSYDREGSWCSDDKKVKTCDLKAHLNKASFMQCVIEKREKMKMTFEAGQSSNSRKQPKSGAIIPVNSS